jgi:hypothetical protein
MIDYYTSEIYLSALKQKRRVLTIYLILLGAYILFSAGMLFWFSTLTYKSNTVLTIKLIHYPISFVFFVFSIFYIGIKYKRVKRFCVECNFLENGIRETSEATFFEYSEDRQDKNGVDFKALIFLEWNKYKKDYYERKVLVFYELPFPEMEIDAKYRFVTQGNVLIKYEKIED